MVVFGLLAKVLVIHLKCVNCSFNNSVGGDYLRFICLTAFDLLVESGHLLFLKNYLRFDFFYGILVFMSSRSGAAR